MAFLELIGLSKTFGNAPVLRQVGFGLEQGKILCILGASGSGKTTLLRIIAGLETPDEGSVLLRGRDLRHTRPHLRRFGMMFQEFALFPHLNVSENIAFGLKMLKLSRGQIAERTGEMLSLVGLRGFESRKVTELSGGERQRVALARSLAPYPELLLLDEPVGSLDRVLRERLLLDLRGILRRTGLTTIVVTHDQAEAFAISDLVAVMDRGAIVQIDTPENLYRRPASPQVARFLGFVNLVDGRVESSSSVATCLGPLRIPHHGSAEGRAVTVLIRPDAVRLRDPSRPVPPGSNVIEGVVNDCLFKGRSFRLEVRVPGPQVLVFDLPADETPPEQGQVVQLLPAQSALTVMPVE